MKKFILLASIAAAMISCAAVDQKVTVVPYPNEITVNGGTFNAAGADFHYAAEFDEATVNIVKDFAAQLSLVTGKESTVDAGTASKGFTFVYDAALAEEAYQLEVTKNLVTVKASALRGLNYAVQTLKQMLPAEVFSKTAVAGKNWTIPCVTVNDAPRFGYRGLMLDVARHFYTVEEVKQLLDVMEIHKLNKFHWHLTDDQGWRVEIKKYPKLTEIGSIRKQTLVAQEFEAQLYDGKPYGEGMWYTQDQVREVVAYAASKGIDVIPEIDLPGHMLGALAAYPQYGCTGGPYDVWGRWGVSEEVLCAGNEKTMLFLEDILSEIAALFPYEYVHIGGDECPKTSWEKCPKCQAKIRQLGLKDDEHFNAEHYLQSYVMDRMTEFLEGKGKRVIGWDEVLEGKISKSTVVMAWRGADHGAKAARLGNDAIMSPTAFFYFDYYQSLDRANEPLAIGGYLPIEKSYSFEPLLKGLTDEEKTHILGVQANLWTEYIGSFDHVLYMLLPRMGALAEVQWCQPDNKNYERFLASTPALCNIYDVLGCRYATHIFDTKGEVYVNRENGGGLEVALKTVGEEPIHYTLDGTEPTADSPVYTKPIQIKESCVLKAKSSRNGKATRTYVNDFSAHKAMGRPTTLLTEPHGSYKFRGADQIVDGMIGKGPYNSGEYVGWYGKPFEAVVEMDGTAYNTVALSTYVFTWDYIFAPKNLIVSTSEDGNEYTEVARVEFPELAGHLDAHKEYVATFPETTAKYLKVTAETVKSMPKWHAAAGSQAFVFVDELIVR